jgi:pimeloyl-ACP methyl ester carboxylesterase
MTPVLVCLHGWGASKESFTELRDALRGTDIQILTPDLPGFGTTREPDRPWTVDDYADWVEEWIATRNQESGIRNQELFLLGHSHGGRIALKLAWRQAISSQRSGIRTIHIKHLFLCAAAGIRHPRHFRRIIGLTIAKSGKALLSVPGLRALQGLAKKALYKLIRVHDYERASPLMRETMIRVSAEDLRPLLKNITIPTDIFWGKDDTMTPFSDALIMQREIRGSSLHAFDSVRHRVHRDKANAIADVIRATMEHA